MDGPGSRRGEDRCVLFRCKPDCILCTQHGDLSNAAGDAILGCFGGHGLHVCGARFDERIWGVGDFAMSDSLTIWEVEYLGSDDDTIYTQGFYSTLEKAKASVPRAVWQSPPDEWFASVDDDDGDELGSFTHFYINEREVL